MRQRGGLTSAAISRPIGTLTVTLVVFVLGLFSMERLPIDLLPNVVPPQVMMATCRCPCDCPPAVHLPRSIA